jgi:glycosyltransferase involved in cell wall biosynthesis
LNPKLSDTDLYLITEAYPYGTGEAFIHNELKITSQYFAGVHIFPLNGEGQTNHLLPSNIKIINILKDSLSKSSLRSVLIRNIGLISYILFTEFFRNNRKGKFISGKGKERLSQICSAIIRSEKLYKYISNNKGQKLFYSFWMNDGALILSILKYRNLINRFVFRVHGYDLYGERREGGYMPFRYFNMLQTEAVYTACEYAKKYLVSKNVFPEKVKLSYLGTFDHGTGPFKRENPFTIVSCSNLWPIKGVEKIIEALKYLNFEISWYHFGNGPLMDELLLKSKQLPSNIKWEFKGHFDNSALMEFYGKNQVNLFISLSETEGGVPVSMQEAASFGIPLIGTRVGGIPEIVNENTGILLKPNPEPKEVAESIKIFRQGEMNASEFREKVRQFWKANFNAEINYVNFMDEIINL